VAAYGNLWREKVRATSPRTQTIFLVDTHLYYDPSSGPRLRPSLAAPFRAPTFVYCKGGRTGQRYVCPSFLTPQVHSRRCGITQHDKGQAPLANPQRGACPPRASRNGAQMGATQEAPCLCTNGAQHERGAHGHAGAPLLRPTPVYARTGLRRKPPFAPFAGRGKVRAPSLGPRSHANREVCPPFLPRKCLRPAPVCARTRFAPESCRGMALPFRHEQALCRKPPPRLRGVGR
jgi:hypothetical protein